MFASEPTQPQAAPGIFDAAVRYGRTTIAVTLAGVALGLLLTILTPSSFTASTKIALTDPSGSPAIVGSTSSADFERYAASRAEFANSTAVLESAAESFPRSGGVDQLRTNCGVTASDVGVLSVECSSSEERTALGSVEAIVSSYRMATTAQLDKKVATALETLEGDRQELTDALRSGASGDPYAAAYADAAAVRLAQIDEQIAKIRTSQALFGDGVDSADPARVPAGAGFVTQAVRNIIVGGLVGLIGAVLVAWFRADRMPIGESSTDVSQWLELPLLGEVDYELVRGDSIDMVAIPEPSFQRITSNLEAVLIGETVLFTPAEAMEHHPDVVVKSALVAARAGKRVLLIDSDAVNRSVSTVLGLPDGAGFSEFVSGSATAEEATVRLGFGRNAGVGSAALYLMGPGAEGTSSASLLRTGDAEQALTDLRRHYDLILVAGPPLLTSAGSAVLGQAVDGVVVIIERGTARTAIEEARRQLNFLASETLGFVFVHGS